MKSEYKYAILAVLLVILSFVFISHLKGQKNPSEMTNTELIDAYQQLRVEIFNAQPVVKTGRYGNVTKVVKTVDEVIEEKNIRLSEIYIELMNRNLSPDEQQRFDEMTSGLRELQKELFQKYMMPDSEQMPSEL